MLVVNKQTGNVMRLSRVARKAMMKQMRSNGGLEDAQRQGIFQRGAAKILGLVSSHIYASKPE